MESLLFCWRLRGIALERKADPVVPPSPQGRRSVLANLPPSPTTSVTDIHSRMRAISSEDIENGASEGP